MYFYKLLCITCNSNRLNKQQQKKKKTISYQDLLHKHQLFCRDSDLLYKTSVTISCLKHITLNIS